MIFLPLFFKSIKYLVIYLLFETTIKNPIQYIYIEKVSNYIIIWVEFA